MEREYGDGACVRRDWLDIRLDHGGRMVWLSGEGESEGDMGRANAFAVEL